eukprot:GGOE01009875.1.p2 GENE.GGOE01009875.1~~GGOE01009875.1.p2  ORF type:complete len:173 (+),score=1.57 GGOE01009875.1:1273-1791(+)
MGVLPLTFLQPFLLFHKRRRVAEAAPPPLRILPPFSPPTLLCRRHPSSKNPFAHAHPATKVPSSIAHSPSQAGEALYIEHMQEGVSPPAVEVDSAPAHLWDRRLLPWPPVPHGLSQHVMPTTLLWFCTPGPWGTGQTTRLEFVGFVLSPVSCVPELAHTCAMSSMSRLRRSL